MQGAVCGMGWGLSMYQIRTVGRKYVLKVDEYIGTIRIILDSAIGKFGDGGRGGGGGGFPEFSGAIGGSAGGRHVSSSWN